MRTNLEKQFPINNTVELSEMKRRFINTSWLGIHQPSVMSLFVVFAMAGAVMLRAAEPATRPNVLFLFTDDQRHDTIHALGNDAIRTPNIDRLVGAGVVFRNAYIMGGSSPAVCSPSRACLMSGRTLWNIECQGEYGFEISEKYKTLPQVFRENGYVTFGTGKNEPGRAGAFRRSFSAGDKILFRGMTKSQYQLPLCAFSPDGKYPKGAEVTAARQTLGGSLRRRHHPVLLKGRQPTVSRSLPTSLSRRHTTRASVRRSFARCIRMRT